MFVAGIHARVIFKLYCMSVKWIPAHIVYIWARRYDGLGLLLEFITTNQSYRIGRFFFFNIMALKGGVKIAGFHKVVTNL